MSNKVIKGIHSLLSNHQTLFDFLIRNYKQCYESVCNMVNNETNKPLSLINEVPQLTKHILSKK